mmetsp:Transcript_105171/g.326872  ORF Transcript_105171/g.326872 Transcript_105171/m.326872 type:complete len:272 (-) Transcript_105171:339-1154(-)
MVRYVKPSDAPPTGSPDSSHREIWPQSGPTSVEAAAADHTRPLAAVSSCRASSSPPVGQDSAPAPPPPSTGCAASSAAPRCSAQRTSESGTCQKRRCDRQVRCREVASTAAKARGVAQRSSCSCSGTTKAPNSSSRAPCSGSLVTGGPMSRSNSSNAARAAATPPQPAAICGDSAKPLFMKVVRGCMTVSMNLPSARSAVGALSSQLHSSGRRYSSVAACTADVKPSVSCRWQRMSPGCSGRSGLGAGEGPQAACHFASSEATGQEEVPSM